jgi:predicted RNA-binding Zn-ribbon protein involved in translation (DUF1610 family)
VVITGGNEMDKTKYEIECPNCGATNSVRMYCTGCHIKLGGKKQNVDPSG